MPFNIQIFRFSYGFLFLSYCLSSSIALPATSLEEIGNVSQACLSSEKILRVNDIQSIGSHNSYKLFIPEPELDLLKEYNESQALTLDYNHLPLVDQLDLGLRQLELDVFYDPDGSLFISPLLSEITKGSRNSVEFRDEGMEIPGFKVLHTMDIDVHSNCNTWIKCLTEIRDWSLANPSHLPVLIMFNAKEGGSNFPNASKAPQFSEAAFIELEKETLSVLNISQIITPDDVRGEEGSLREAVLQNGWPSLENSRGRVIFAVDEGPGKVRTYARGMGSLEGLPFFVNSISEDSDHAAYFTRNDPITNQDEITRLVRRGFLVRTRADASTLEARINDSSRREAAFKSGAHFISTDYYLPRIELSDYSVTLPKGNPSRLNPIRFKEKCNLGY